MPTAPQFSRGFRQSGAHRFPGTRARRTRAMTLFEVLIAFSIITLFAASAISFSLFNERRTMANFYRLEAYRLAQSISEHAMEVQFPAQFTPAWLMATNDPVSATQWQWTGTEKAMLRSSSQDKVVTTFTYPASAGGVTFTKNITAGADVGAAKVLNIVITWSFAGNNYSISVPVLRGGN